MRKKITGIGRVSLFIFVFTLVFSSYPLFEDNLVSARYPNTDNLPGDTMPHQNCPGASDCPDETVDTVDSERFGTHIRYFEHSRFGRSNEHRGFSTFGPRNLFGSSPDSSPANAFYPATVPHDWVNVAHTYREEKNEGPTRGLTALAPPRCPYNTALLEVGEGQHNRITDYCSCGSEDDRYLLEVGEGNYCEENYVACIDGDCEGDKSMTGFFPSIGANPDHDSGGPVFSFEVENHDSADLTVHPTGGTIGGIDRYSTWFKSSEDQTLSIRFDPDSGSKKSSIAVYKLDPETDRLTMIVDDVTNDRERGETSSHSRASGGFYIGTWPNRGFTAGEDNYIDVNLEEDAWYFFFAEHVSTPRTSQVDWTLLFHTDGQSRSFTDFTESINSFGPLGVYARDDPEFCGGGSKTPEFTDELPENESLENTACSEIGTYQLIDVRQDTTDEEHANACRSIGCPAPGEPANRCEVDREVFDHLEENTDNHHFDNSEARCSFDMCDAIGEGSVDLRDDKDRRGQVDNTGEYACVMSNQLTSDVNSYSYAENTGDAGWYFSTRQSWLLDGGSWENCPAWASSENKECIDTPTDSNRLSDVNNRILHEAVESEWIEGGSSFSLDNEEIVSYSHETGPQSLAEDGTVEVDLQKRTLDSSILEDIETTSETFRVNEFLRPDYLYSVDTREDTEYMLFRGPNPDGEQTSFLFDSDELVVYDGSVEFSEDYSAFSFFENTIILASDNAIHMYDFDQGKSVEVLSERDPINTFPISYVPVDMFVDKSQVYILDGESTIHEYTADIGQGMQQEQAYGLPPTRELEGLYVQDNVDEDQKEFIVTNENMDGLREITSYTHSEDNEGPASIDVQRPTMCVQDTEEADGNMLKQFEGDKDYGIAPIAYLDGTEKSIYFNTTGEPEAVWETTTANSINQDQLIDSIGREEYEFVFKLPFNDDVEENWKDINVSINNGETVFSFNDSANINPVGPHRFTAETTVESITFESPISIDIDVTRIAATDYEYECGVNGYAEDISENMCEHIYGGTAMDTCCGQNIGTQTANEWGISLMSQPSSCFRGNKIDAVDISENVNNDYSNVLHSQGDFHVCGDNLPHPEGVPPSNIETYETGNTYTPISEESSEYICGQGEWIVFDGQDRIPTLLSHAHRLVDGVTNEHKILCGPMNRILPSVNEPHVSCIVSNRENNQAIGLLTMASSSEELATATSQAQDFNGSMIGDSCYSEEENGFQRCNNFVSDNLIDEHILTSVEEPGLYVNTNYNISVITTITQSRLPDNYNYPDGGLASILQRIGHIVSEFFDAGEEFVLPAEGNLEATYVESSDETQIISSFIKDGQRGKITYRITPGLEDPSEIDRRFDLTFGNLVGDRTINSTTEETRLELDSGVAMDTSYYDAWRTFASIR